MYSTNLRQVLHIRCWELTHVRGGKEGHSGKGSYSFTHPVLALGRNAVSCAGECLDSSGKSKKGKSLFSLCYQETYGDNSILYPVLSNNNSTWEGVEDARGIDVVG